MIVIIILLIIWFTSLGYWIGNYRGYNEGLDDAENFIKILLGVNEQEDGETKTD